MRGSAQRETKERKDEERTETRENRGGGDKMSREGADRQLRRGGGWTEDSN